MLPIRAREEGVWVRPDERACETMVKFSLMGVQGTG